MAADSEIIKSQVLHHSLLGLHHGSYFTCPPLNLIKLHVCFVASNSRATESVWERHRSTHPVGSNTLENQTKSSCMQSDFTKTNNRGVKLLSVMNKWALYFLSWGKLLQFPQMKQIEMFVHIFFFLSSSGGKYHDESANVSLSLLLCQLVLK